MITSNYANSTATIAPTRATGATLENQQASEGAPKDANSWELQSYASDANQDVQNLKNQTWEEPPYYQLTVGLGHEATYYSVKVNVRKMSEQDTSFPPFGPVQQSRLYLADLQCDELARDFPELVGRPLVLDIAKGIDSRLGVQVALTTLLEDAVANKGTVGHEPRTGAQVVQGPEGLEGHPVGGRDGLIGKLAK